VVEVLGSRAVKPDIVGAPALPEVRAAGGQLADQVMERLVVRIAAGFGPQDGDGDVGGGVPVRVEPVGVVVEEGVAGEVGLPAGVTVVER
jgi:hypothetical protein